MASVKLSFRDHKHTAESEKRAVTKRKQDGLCLKGFLLSNVFETKIGEKQTTKFSFDVYICFDTKDIRMPSNCTSPETNVLLMEHTTRDGQPLTHELKSGTVVRFSSFKKPEGKIKSGCCLTLYNVEGGYYTNRKTGDTMFSYSCKSSKAKQMKDSELMKTWKGLPNDVFFSENKPSFEQYRPGPVRLNVVPNKEKAMELFDKNGSGTYVCIENFDDAKFEITTKAGDKVMMFEPSGCYWSYGYNKGEEDVGIYEITLWSDKIIDMFGIANLERWKKFGPKFVRHINAVYLGYVDKERTLTLPSNGDDYSGDDKWAISSKITSVLTDQKENIRNVAYEVTCDFVKNVVFPGQPFAQSTDAQTNTWSSGIDYGIMNMHETIGAREEIYKRDNVKYWFVPMENVRPEEHEKLMSLSTEERSACFTPKDKSPKKKKKKTNLIHVDWSECIVYADFN